MADFASLAEIKAALEITDTASDAQLAGLPAVVTSMILDFLDRDPRSDDTIERTNGLGTPELCLNRFPITAVAGVTLDGFGPIPLAEIDFDEHLVWRKNGVRFPRGRKNVSVSYTAGLDPLPKLFKQAAIYTARALWTSRRVDLNSTGESWAGVTSQAWSQGAPGILPLAAQNLLQKQVAVISFG